MTRDLLARDLLVRGMLAGLLAALLAVLFARLVGEPQVDLAITFEDAHARAMGMAQDAELVSRAVQKSLGLLTAIVLYGSALGGLFSIIFTLCYGRVAVLGPRTLALLLAIAAFAAVTLAPALKYPPNPPGVGLPGTIDYRTQTYFAMLVFSVVGLLIAGFAGRKLMPRFGVLNGVLAAVGAYILIVAGLILAMPTINEVPSDFPANVLWNFRIASLGIQVVLWSAIGVIFGLLAEHRLRAAHRRA
jgi:predicted cobalt transporter CbtA